MTHAVVVGSGAGGGIVAKELAVAGWRVTLLERGPWLKTSSFGHLETRDSWTSGIGHVPYGPWPGDVRTVRPAPHDPVLTVAPRDPLYGTLPAVVGGGTVYYGAFAWRFHPETFRLRSYLGDVPSANLEDWPVSYDDLEPYYEKAEYDLGVSGDDNPYGPPRRRPLPLPPFADNEEAAVLYPAARRLGWRPFHTPLAILSRPYRGRPACVGCSYCNGFGCEVAAKSSTLVAAIPEALETGRCRLVPHAFVREITVDARGQPDGVVYQAGEPGRSRWQRLPADVIVVCCSATEAPRLLLNSKSKWFPLGLGNEHDQVGRNIENDGNVSAYGLFDQVVTGLTGPGPTFAVDDFQFRPTSDAPGTGRPSLLGGMLSNLHVRPPLGFVERVGTPAGVPHFGEGLKGFYRRYFLRSIFLYATCHTFPRYENRVDTDPRVRDARGVPVSRITYHQHPSNAEHEQFMVDRCQELLREAGAHTVVASRVERGTESGVATHQQGSCRMGRDPRSSVVDRTGRLHGLPNVYIADGSLLPNPGGMNPSLTIQALAYWVSHHILKDHSPLPRLEAAPSRAGSRQVFQGRQSSSAHVLV